MVQHVEVLVQATKYLFSWNCTASHSLICACINIVVTYQSNRTFNITPTGNPQAFQLFKFGLFKLPSPGPKMVFKCPIQGSY